MGRRLKQVDIARLAGVSQATVSLVLSGSRQVHLSEKTRQRILEIATELGYTIDPVARQLAGGKNRVLGLYTFERVFPIEHRDFYYPFLLGIEEECEAQAHDLLLFASAGDPTGRRSIYRDGINRLRLADGCILEGSVVNTAELQRIAGEGMPFVFIGRREVPGVAISYVTADYDSAMHELIAHLAVHGHQRVAYVGEVEVVPAAAEREAGYQHAVGRLGLESDPSIVRRVSPEQVTPALLRRLFEDGVTAMMVEHPTLAARVRDVAAGLGRFAPSDYSIATLGDLPGLGDEEPWTTFEIPRREMGRRAVQELIEIIDAADGQPRQVSLPCRLAPGQTTGPAPATER